MHERYVYDNYCRECRRSIKEWKDNIDSDSDLQARLDLNCLMIQFAAD